MMAAFSRSFATLGIFVGALAVAALVVSLWLLIGVFVAWDFAE